MTALNFDVRLNGKQLQSDIDGVNAKLKSMTSGIAQEGQNIDDIFKKIGLGIGAYFGVQQIGSFVSEIAKVRGEFQDLNTSFETILSSKEKADKLMAQVVQFAATTPFTLKDVAGGTKQLLAYGFAAEGMVGNLRMLGDVAAGTSTPINDLIYLYGTLQTQGRAYTKDIMQFTGRGIPIIAELAKQMGVAKNEVQGMVEAGKVGFPEVEKAFKAMTGAGGMFGGLMEKQAKNINGLYSNLVDSISLAQNEIGKSNEGAIAGAIKMTTTLVKNYEKVGTVVGSVIALYGSYKAAVMLVALAESYAASVETTRLGIIAAKKAAFAAEFAMQGAKVTLTGADIAATELATAAEVRHAMATKASAKAKALLNATMLANPYVLGAVAITAVVAGLVMMNRAFEESIDAQKLFNKQSADLEESYNKRITAAESLIGILQNESKAEFERIKALEELKKLYPDLFANIDIYNAKMNLTAETVSKVTLNEKERNLELQRQKIRELVAERERLEKSIAAQPYTTNQYGGVSINYKDVATLQSVNKQIEMNGQKELDMIMEIANANAIKAAEAQKTIQQRIKEADSIVKLTALQKTWNESRDAATNDADRNKYISELKLIDSALDNMQGKQKKREDELKVAQEALTKAIESGSQAQIKAAAKRVDALEKEKLKIEEIAKLELDRAWRAQFDGQKMEAMKSKGSKDAAIDYIGKQKTGQDVNGNTVLFEITAIDKTGPTWKKVKIEAGKLKKQVDEGAKDSAKKQEDLDKAEAERKKKFKEDLLNYSRQFTSELITQLGLTESQSEAMNAVADTIFNLAKGDYAAAAFSAASYVTKLMIEGLKEQKILLSDYYKTVEERAKKVTESVNLINEALKNIGSGASVAGLNMVQGELMKLKNNAARLNEELKNIVNTNSGGGRRGGSGVTSVEADVRPYIERARITASLIDQTAALRAQIELLSQKLLDPTLTNDQRDSIKSILNGYNDVISTINSTIQDITGITYDSLSQAFSDAFLSGEDAAVKWGEKVNEIIKNIVGKQLTAKLLSDPITAAVNTLVKDQADGFTPEEAKKFKDAINGIYTTVAPAYQAAIDALKLQGIDLTTGKPNTTNSSLSGAVKGIEEDTASLIAGQLMAIRDYQIRGFENGNAMLSAINIQVSHLANIVINTARIENVENELKSMNRTLNERL